MTKLVAPVLGLFLALLTLVLALNKDGEDFISANNQFASSVYEMIDTDSEENFVMSPLSAEIALALIETGAKGNSALELQNALHLPHNKTKISLGAKSLYTELQPKSYLHLALRLYLRKGLVVKEIFRRVARNAYRAEVESVDFGKKTKTLNTINRWVENQTKNRRKSLLSVEDLMPDAVLVALLHIQAEWAVPFQPSATRDTIFYKSMEKSFLVETMFLQQQYLYYYECQELDATFLEMPFEDPDASMVVVLPNQIQGLSLLEYQMDRVLQPRTMSLEVVDVLLPKFKIDNTMDLRQLLKVLGVHRIFDKDKTNLSALAGRLGAMIMGKIYQNTYIEVSEGGVESMVAAAPGLWPEYDSIKIFYADHPFIFYVKVKEAVVLVGRVTDPTI